MATKLTHEMLWIMSAMAEKESVGNIWPLSRLGREYAFAVLESGRSRSLQHSTT